MEAGAKGVRQVAETLKFYKYINSKRVAKKQIGHIKDEIVALVTAI